jgi:serine/threonine protein kinase
MTGSERSSCFPVKSLFPHRIRRHPGTKLGPYEIVSALGAGGMGEVYRARDSRLGSEVAIKIRGTYWSKGIGYHIGILA